MLPAKASGRAILLLLLLLAAPAWADVPRLPPAKPAASQGADFILVEKGERTLTLFSNGKAIARYPVQLGKQPEGHKTQEGDNRTPEGTYFIDWRNPESAFFRSLRISYPSQADKERAAAAGVDPGNMIMIHGMPNDTAYRREVWEEPNWTNGCIALRDHHMVEVWDLVAVGTPIEIRP